MIIICDLDDTLYEEISYVKSGFLAVADYLQKKYAYDEMKTYQFMLEELQKNGRGKIFDVVLNQNGICTNAIKAKCLSVYRNHEPKIELHEAAKRFLKRFSNYRKYIVTDGNLLVQRKKLKALNLKNDFVQLIPTHQYGKDKAKPSTYCFEKIMNKENCKPQEMVYIGDNPLKDFVNINKMGIHTIRVLTGEYKNKVVAEGYNAKKTIVTLDELSNEASFY